MIAHTPALADRGAFNGAMSAILSDHATLRRLAASASKDSSFCTDDTLSLADAMAAHERTEAVFFSLPYLTPPGTVTATAARAHRRCLEYTSGNHHLPDPSAAAALFVEALLAHLASEEAWLAHEQAEKDERMWTSI